MGFWQNLVVKLGLRNFPLAIFLIEGRPLCSSFFNIIFDLLTLQIGWLQAHLLPFVVWKALFVSLH